MNSIGWAILFKTGCFCTREQLTINGAKYTVLDNIATGGFSMIDLVENNTTRTKFALKRITCHSIDDQDIALKEIELMSRINSENVIRVIDHAVTGQADIVVNATSEVYIVLPYYKNGSLQDHLNFRARNKDCMPEGQILQLFLGICEGLRAFHEAQPEPLAHRDLKTANICLSNGMEPIIVDLGSAAVARVQIRGQQEAQKLKDLAEERCSIVYRAPELFSVESYCMIDERTDIWSLGCILYAMCSPTAKCPFDPIYEKGDSVALAVLSGNITFSDDWPYSQDMQNLITFMLRINPMERPFVYSVIERTNDLIGKLESRI
ncbi:probable serine/threonine-protein kinase DDB_G0291350 [Bradysia coprophila]|uniref:probable serine/threonine-protein kinase DDB_G0291350 n=1 Tax=Bradysia coprophila TaxID=38358 RepID=UPI00187D9FCE|nr:probable serine/threonine-protein kinase DDB_G0291350 [Bradysia coprophila]